MLSYIKKVPYLFRQQVVPAYGHFAIQTPPAVVDKLFRIAILTDEFHEKLCFQRINSAAGISSDRPVVGTFDGSFSTLDSGQGFYAKRAQGVTTLKKFQGFHIFVTNWALGNTFLTGWS